MEDPRMSPTARQRVGSEDIETTLTLADLIAVYDASNTNERKAISLLTLMTNMLIRFVVNTMTVTGTIDLDTTSVVFLNHSSVAIVATIAAPIEGHLLIIYQIDSGTAGHTVVLTAGTFDGTNDTATLNAQDECIVVLGESATRFRELINLGTVAYS